MRIYDINPNDGTAINPAGRQAPRDPMRRTPRIPAGATDIEPPATGEHQAARWAGDDWQVVPDYRGHVYYTDDGERHEITELGTEPPADALDQAPPEPLDTIAARKRAELNTARDEAFAAGLPYEIDGQQDVVQTRAQDQINLLGLNAKATRLISSGNAETLMEFRGLSNVSHWIDAEAMDDMTMAALSYIEDIYQQSWERKDALDAAHAAEDREAIEAVVW